jgi:hypothetical protein
MPLASFSSTPLGGGRCGGRRVAYQGAPCPPPPSRVCASGRAEFCGWVGPRSLAAAAQQRGAATCGAYGPCPTSPGSALCTTELAGADMQVSKPSSRTLVAPVVRPLRVSTCVIGDALNAVVTHWFYNPFADNVGRPGLGLSSGLQVPTHTPRKYTNSTGFRSSSAESNERRCSQTASARPLRRGLHERPAPRSVLRRNGNVTGAPVRAACAPCPPSCSSLAPADPRERSGVTPVCAKLAKTVPFHCSPVELGRSSRCSSTEQAHRKGQPISEFGFAPAAHFGPTHSQATWWHTGGYGVT